MNLQIVEVPPAQPFHLPIRKWQDIMESNIQPPKSIVQSLIEEGGISLLVARQKEGKSMLSAQMAIDVSHGEPFLGQLATERGTVLYVDYENRAHRIKSRGEDLARGRKLDGVYFAAYDRIADRDLGLDGSYLDRLSGVNYFSRSATIILPYRRQLLSFHRGSALLHWS